MSDTAPLVLHVAESAGCAGGETWLLSLARAIDTRRFRLGVVAPEPGPLVTRLDALGVPTFIVPLNRRLVDARTLGGLVSVLRRTTPAIVHSHGARSNVYARLAARLAGVRVAVSTVHNSLFDYDVPPVRRRLYLLAERVTSGLAHRVVAVSRAIADDLVRRYRLPAAKVVTIANGIDADGFVPDRLPALVRADLGLDTSDAVVLVAARLTPQKGHDVLLAALPSLVARVPRLVCLFSGEGPRGPALRAQADALGVARHCLFTGARADVAALMAAADVVALPSRSEGMPFALLEAMALGRPVVATRVGGSVELVEDGHSGRLVPVDDAFALGDALAELLADRGRAHALGVNAARRVRTHFTLAGMVSRLEDLYDHAVTSAALDRAGSRRHRRDAVTVTADTGRES